MLNHKALTKDFLNPLHMTSSEEVERAPCT